MPIFNIRNKKAEQLETEEFQNEKELQTFFESNLEELLGVRFMASEFWTGGAEGGYVDTIGIDENNAPVAIEYKWGEKENVINQGLYYIDRILEHKGEFELAVQKRVKDTLTINWKQPRLILIARSFNKYDQHAVKRMGGNIELVRYTLYKDGTLNLESLFSGSLVAGKPGESAEQKGEVKDPFQTRLDWLAKTSPNGMKLYSSLREEILNLDKDINERHLKNGANFRLGSKAFVSLSPWQNYIRVLLLYRGQLNDPKKIARDVTKIGTPFAATYDFQVKDFKEIPYAIQLIKQAYEAAT
jgi:predicted transport protein